MDSYEDVIARQPTGNFSNRKERQTIRANAEHWVRQQRYSEERSRRLVTYGKWIGWAVPIILGVWKLAETFLFQG